VALAVVIVPPAHPLILAVSHGIPVSILSVDFGCGQLGLAERLTFSCTSNRSGIRAFAPKAEIIKSSS
jgi:hypothetical protein